MNNSPNRESLPTLGALRRTFVQKLTPVWGDEAGAIVRTLLEEVFALDLTGLVLNSDKVVSEGEKATLDVMVARLSNGEPVQYVVGHSYFCGLRIGVAPGVLIPRPETEELVEWVCRHGGEGNPDILDIGTGSGCIALAIADSLKNARVSAVDVSDDALRIASANAERLGLDVRFRHVDILTAQASDFGRGFDIVVSNPPYVCMREKVEMARHVLEHEPHTALFVSDDDPLVFYRAIAKLCKNGMLCAGGHLFFEINEAFGRETSQMLIDMGFKSVEVRKDYTGRERMAHGEL